MIAVISGGVGAARFLSGLTQVVEPAEITAIGNVGDDIELHRLHVSPDLDTITYTLAGAINPDTGWGLAGESWQAMETLGRYGGPTWFNLGDRDLGTHLYRSGRMSEGATLAEVTAEITRAWGVDIVLLPATNDRLRTMITVAGEGEISFQEYFVHRQHAVPVAGIRFDGAQASCAAPGVFEAIESAEMVVIAPSNPLVSIDPVLAVPGLRAAVMARRDRTVAISPIVAGAAIKGPADRLMRELGHVASVVGVSEIYAELASTLVVDEADAALAQGVEAAGLRCIVAPTIMSDPQAAGALAETVLGAFP
ncbi:MAG: 2-phospho-L-lactate transferase [Actinomycetota bacterium]|nr:2-phospho-L-lactate transferase [Actinomycetota bacterium]